MKKQIVIIGMGLIGGSLSMALRGFEDYEVVGVDRDAATLAFAESHAAADRVTADGDAAVRTADVVFLCLHPRGIVDFLSAHRAEVKAALPPERRAAAFAALFERCLERGGPLSEAELAAFLGGDGQ